MDVSPERRNLRSQRSGERRQTARPGARCGRGGFEGRRLCLVHRDAARSAGESKGRLTKAGIKPPSAEIAMVPQNYIKLTGPQAVQMVRLVEALEEHDDVQHVYANFDIDESEIQAAVGAH